VPEAILWVGLHPDAELVLGVVHPGFARIEFVVAARASRDLGGACATEGAAAGVWGLGAAPLVGS